MITPEAKDAVTIGKIRLRLEALLEDQIGCLGGIIRSGYFNRAKDEAFLNETIGETLTRLQNLDAMASTEVCFPMSDVKTPMPKPFKGSFLR